MPSRIWIAWDGLPPDKAKVVERHGWSWRLWIDEEELVKTVATKLKNQIYWACDFTNEVVANGEGSIE